MNKFLGYFFALLPALIHGVSAMQASGKDKKATVEAALVATAEGVAAVSPSNGESAALAAQVAIAGIDGVHAILKSTGVLKNPAPAPALVSNAVKAAEKIQETAAPALAPSSETPGAEDHTPINNFRER